MKKIPISVLVQTKNEEKGITQCLAALADFDEVIVVDSNSTDRTAELAEKAGARVVNFTWNGSFPQKKQWQLEHVETRHDWILMLDADEYPTPELVLELAEIAEDPAEERVAFDLPIAYWFAGTRLEHGHRVVKRSFLLRGRNAFRNIDLLHLPGMGEVEAHYQPRPSGPVGRTAALLVHNDADPVRTWFDRHNRYSDWEAYLRNNPKTRGYVRESKSRQGRQFDVIPFKPLVFFLYSYVLRRGFLDGRAGFDYAMALSTYYWQIGLKSRELLRLRQEQPADPTKLADSAASVDPA
ncbi:glycosyltransferase family 2 protein [Arthrobacter koreensis]|uniref:glycosyltransferase family 2 protein n=1 Tax=Arthrobacter TaxID=1663 RepID=UPI0036DB5889